MYLPEVKVAHASSLPCQKEHLAYVSQTRSYN